MARQRNRARRRGAARPRSAAPNPRPREASNTEVRRPASTASENVVLDGAAFNKLLNELVKARVGQIPDSPPIATQGDAWLAVAERELNELEASPIDGVAARPRAIKAARRILNELRIDLPKPEIGAGQKGQVTFDWWGMTGYSLTVEIHEDERPEKDRMVYSALFGQSSMSATELLNVGRNRAADAIAFALSRIRDAETDHDSPDGSAL